MTIYAYQSGSSQILAVWPVGVGHRAEVIVDATGLPAGFVQRLCLQLGCLSECLWETYARPAACADPGDHLLDGIRSCLVTIAQHINQPGAPNLADVLGSVSARLPSSVDDHWSDDPDDLNPVREQFVGSVRLVATRQHERLA